MTELATTNKKVFNLNPQSLEQAESFAKTIAKSSLCPNSFKGKSDDVLVAILMGAEVGLSPMQALQNIAVINGRPTVYGDAAIALVRANNQCEYVKEWSEGSYDKKNFVAYCEGKRKGQEPELRKFSYGDAERAQLLKKPGVWQQYPERMIQMRARGFCLRDVFADALKGLEIKEEAQDKPTYQVINQESDRAKELNKRLGLTHTNTDAHNVTKEYADAQTSESPESKHDQETGEVIMASKEEVKELRGLISDNVFAQELVDKWLEHAKAKSFEDMTSEQIQKCIKFIHNRNEYESKKG